MIVTSYAIPGIILLLILGSALLALAAWHPPVRVSKTSAWSNYRFGFSTYALIFLSFDMEMIFMYPWAVVFADMGLKAFLDMFVFIAILASGIAYAWGLGGLEWE
ncbi:MAG TPA: NADH-quinone oxidoreductase subunit A [Candidatus Binatia bacterium]|nr:NADH-quinone oxidoreductase subunit A [Candidatus Binatia bacterium]